MQAEMQKCNSPTSAQVEILPGKNAVSGKYLKWGSRMYVLGLFLLCQATQKVEPGNLKPGGVQNGPHRIVFKTFMKWSLLSNRVLRFQQKRTLAPSIYPFVCQSPHISPQFSY